MTHAETASQRQRVSHGEANRDNSSLTLTQLVGAWHRHRRALALGTIAAGVMAYGAATMVTPTFTAATSFMPPQQNQGGAAAALATLGSLGSLAGLGGSAGGAGNSADRYVGLMQSVTLSDRIIEQFKLMDSYGVKFRVDARKELASNVRISVGKKDGLISVEVDDHSPQQAADIANRYVVELRQTLGSLAVTEAQQRRLFFEQQLGLSRDRLALAQKTLQASGFNAGALKAEPKAAAEAYGRLKAETSAAEVRLETLRGSLADKAPEIIQQQSQLAALRLQLARSEQVTEGGNGADYIGRYRDFKYQEALFELYARQFEIARVDESREGALIQVVDVATPPERKSKPQRTLIALATGSVFLFFACIASGILELRAARRRNALVVGTPD